MRCISSGLQRCTTSLALVLLVLLVAPTSVRPGGAQEDADRYRVVQGIRLGRYVLGVPLEALGLPRESSRWEVASPRAPFAVGYWFAESGLRVHTCQSDGRVIAIATFSAPGASAESRAEAGRYRTVEGLRIGMSEGEIQDQWWWFPTSSGESDEQVGPERMGVTVYTLPGPLQVYVGREGRRVVGLGVTSPEAWSACELAGTLLHALRSAAEKPISSSAPPVALTACESSGLPRRLLDDAESRRLFVPLLMEADVATQEPPSPLSRLFIQDLMPTDPRVQVSMRFFYRDVRRTEALGYAFVATGDGRYAERAVVYLEAWARGNRPNGEAITETEIVRLVRGFSLVGEQIPPSVRAEVTNWLRQLASLQIERRPQWELAPPWGPNNHHSHRLKIVGAIGYALGDSGFVRYAEEGYRRQVAENLRPDGSSLDFHVRDALHYHVYNLEPLLELAIVAEKNGTSLYDHRAPSGASLDRSIAFLIPYVRGERVHREFARSPVALDRQRGEAGIPGFQVGVPWNPRGAARLLEMAGYFNPAFANEPIHGQAPRTFQTVLNALRAACGRR